MLYDRIPVDPDRWLDDPEYMGNVGKEMFPKLREDFIDTFEGDYTEVILTGAIGWGKSWWTELGILRCVYETSCYRNPQRAFGLATGSQIMLVNISVKEELARKVIFQGIKTKAAQSPFFTNVFPFDKHISTELRFPKNLTIFPAASTTTSVLGLNIIGGSIDESNFMPIAGTRGEVDALTGRKRTDKAEMLYTAFSRRMKSRFSELGSIPGKLFLVSSTGVPSSFLEKRIAEAENEPNVKVIRYSQWEPKPRKKFSSRTFKVEVGDLSRQSRILRDDVDKKTIRGRVIEVPEDFRPEFEKDIEGSLQDYAGIAVMSIQPFFRDYDKLIACFHSDRKHPFNREVTDLEDGVDILIPEITQVDPETGKRTPKLNPNCPRWAHIDSSLTTDATGISMGHVSDMVPSEDGDALVPCVTLDFMLRVVPPRGKELSLLKVRELLFKFISIGFPLVGVSMDRFQSADMLQRFRDNGVYAVVASVDALEPYKIFKNALYERRVNAYYYEPIVMEARMLQWRPDLKKPDHPAKGSKDVLDAACGVVNALHTYRLRMPVEDDDGAGVTVL
jgi:hypothetical protein